MVFNLAAETKYGQAEEVYEEKVYLLSVTAAKEAAKRGIRTFVEVSTGQVYEAGKVIMNNYRKHPPKEIRQSHGQQSQNQNSRLKKK